MLKKFLILIGIVSTLSFTSCGGGSSKEARELLSKILQFIGIPHSIIVNVCQDSNKDGICGAGELFTKVTINRGDKIDDILQKIALTDDGKYFLETYDPTIPILVELQDVAKVNQDGGKFTLPFNGFDNKKDDNETKEISILASMVDKNHFNDSDLVEIRALENSTTQDKFYEKLLDALEVNLNTLRDVGLDSQNSMLADLKEISSELIANGIKDTLPNDLNRCGTDTDCVDRRLETVSDKITISTEKANLIKERYIEPTATAVPTNSTGSEKRLLILKETNYSENNYNNNNVKSTNTSTTTYEYDNSNKIIKDTNIIVSTYNGKETSRDEKICTYKYDSKNRFIGEVCSSTTNGQTTNSNSDFIYKDNKISASLYYDNNGILSQKWEVLEWDGNRAKKTQDTSYNEDGKESISTWNTTYNGDNPVVLSGESENLTWKKERKFDNKKTPYHYDTIFQSGTYGWFGWFGKNNIVEETTTSSTGDITTITTTKNNITYNSSDMPTKIDVTTSYSTSDITTHTIQTYEYIEAK